MIVLEQCRIDSDNKYLVIEAVVENSSYYENVYIDSIVIDTNDTYSPNGPSNKPIFTKTFDYEHIDNNNSNYCEYVEIDDTTDSPHGSGIKRIRLFLTPRDLNISSFNDNIFFVYIIANGIPAPCTPCGMDNSYTMGVAINMRPIYNMAMQYVRELDSSCSIPRGFTDMILRLKAFDLSMRTGNYPIAFKQWDKLFKNKIKVSPNRGCGCNGIN